MAGSVNKVILVGNLGRDPEIRTLNSGDRVANLNVATSETWRDKSSGERKEKTEWHRVVIFNENLVKVAENYLKKGSKVYIEGQLATRKYEQNGVEKYSTEIVLQRFRGELTMLDGRGDSDHRDQHGVHGAEAPRAARVVKAEGDQRLRGFDRLGRRKRLEPAFEPAEQGSEHVRPHRWPLRGTVGFWATVFAARSLRSALLIPAARFPPASGSSRWGLSAAAPSADLKAADSPAGFSCGATDGLSARGPRPFRELACIIRTPVKAFQALPAAGTMRVFSERQSNRSPSGEAPANTAGEHVTHGNLH